MSDTASPLQHEQVPAEDTQPSVEEEDEFSLSLGKKKKKKKALVSDGAADVAADSLSSLTLTHTTQQVGVLADDDQDRDYNYTEVTCGHVQEAHRGNLMC